MTAALWTGTLSVLMPAHNEAARLFENIRETVNVLEELQGAYEIIVVDDGSGDDTYGEAERAAAEWRTVRAYRIEENVGKGAALREGFGRASGDVVVFLDSDLDLHPRQLHVFFNLMQASQADVVIGSKRHPDSQLDYPIHRRFISAVYFFLIRLLFRLPIHDTQTGLKMFKAQVLRDVFPLMLIKKFAFDLELLLLAHKHGYSIREAPVVIEFNEPIVEGIQTAFTWENIWTTWWDTMALFYRLYILRYYDGR